VGRRVPEWRRVFLGCALTLSIVAVGLVPASAASRSGSDAPTTRSALVDRDRDRLDDVLERRLRRSEAGVRQPVVVATDGSLTLADVHRTLGAFPVSRTLGIIDGFAARLTPGQIRALAMLPGVRRIDHDAVVRVTMDAARADYGVDGARTVLGLTGAGVNVCILDTGADPGHEQLDSKTIVWEDLVAGEAAPYDDHGHGTHVASIAVGDGVGGPAAGRFGGVAPAAGLWAGKVLDGDGSGPESGIVAGIEWCAADPDVDIISMSLGTVLPSDGSDVLSMAANAAVAGGKVVLAAAGNSGDAPDSIAAPGAAADAITVGAVSEWSAAPGPQSLGRHLPRLLLRPRGAYVRRGRQAGRRVAGCDDHGGERQHRRGLHHPQRHLHGDAVRRGLGRPCARGCTCLVTGGPGGGDRGDGGGLRPRGEGSRLGLGRAGRARPGRPGGGDER
jgi:serine protease AprX